MRDHNRAAWTAWHVAALMRVKKLPKIETLFASAKRRRKQTPEQMLTMVKMLNAAFGGRVIEKKKG